MGELNYDVDVSELNKNITVDKTVKSKQTKCISFYNDADFHLDSKNIRVHTETKSIKGYCMTGGIFSDEKCPICGKRFKDNRINALVCPEHPNQKANSFRVYFKGISKRCSSYAEASRALTGYRFKTDENTFDARDYRKENPLAFDKLANDYLLVKKKELKVGSYRNIKKHMFAFIEKFQDTNIKDIGFIEIQKYLLNLENITDKTRFNYLGTLSAFLNWLEKAIENYRKPQFVTGGVKVPIIWRFKNPAEKTYPGCIGGTIN